LPTRIMGWCITISWTASLLIATPAASLELLDSSLLEKFVDPLPNPLNAVINPVGMLDGAPYYEVTIGQFQQKLHRDLAPTTLWGYNNSYPGPTFEVDRGQRINVKWVNNLVDGSGQPLDHLLPYDETLHGAGEGMAGFPQARVVPHLHGGIVPAGSDGFPEHWISPDPNAAPNGLGGPAGNSVITDYPNNQRSTALWYHDHAIGVTRLNVYSGMAGFYFIRDADEQALNLPSGAYEVPMVIQDRSFYEDGSLYYPVGTLPNDFQGDASVVPQFLGDTNLVNGVIWPFMEVEPRKYRLRLLNGANARFYNLVLEDPAQNAVTLRQIGTDEGLLASPVGRNQLLMAPADRADVIVDFSQYNLGDELLLKNLGPDGPFGLLSGPPADPNTTGQVMKFKIVPPTGPDTSSLPDALTTIERLDPSASVLTRQLRLVRSTDEFGRLQMLLDNKVWSDPVSEVVRLGDVEIWEFQNFTPDAHPMHLHLAQFQILERRNRQTGAIIPLEGHELGWEDTVIVNPRENLKIIVRFDQFAGDVVWHCHMLEHEDHEMMRPLKVIVPEPATFTILTLGGTFLLIFRPRSTSKLVQHVLLRTG